MDNTIQLALDSIEAAEEQLGHALDSARQAVESARQELALAKERLDELLNATPQKLGLLSQTRRNLLKELLSLEGER